MITVTERAVSVLEALLADNDAQPGQGVKLVPGGEDSVGLVIEAPSDGDDVIHRGGQPLLIVDEALSGPLDGAQIDCDENLENGQTPGRLMLRRAPE